MNTPLIIVIGLLFFIAFISILGFGHKKRIRVEDRRKAAVIYKFPVVDGKGQIIKEDRRQKPDRRKKSHSSHAM